MTHQWLGTPPVARATCLIRGTDESIDGREYAARPRRPAGSRNQDHHGSTATTRLHAPVKTVVGSRKVLDLCGCIRACAAATGRRPTSS